MSKSSKGTTRRALPSFVDDVLAGRAQPEDIDDYIDRWHDAPSDSPEALLQLHDFLGMSWDEYQQWSGKSDSLRAVLSARQAKYPELDTPPRHEASQRTIAVTGKDESVLSAANAYSDWQSVRKWALIYTIVAAILTVVLVGVLIIKTADTKSPASLTITAALGLASLTATLLASFRLVTSDKSGTAMSNRRGKKRQQRQQDDKERRQ